MKKHRKLKITLISICAILVVCVAGFFIYVSDYYRAEDIAIEVLENDKSIEKIDNLTILKPSTPTETGIIFYPGAKVEAIAYLPILDKLRANGVVCVLVEMPFNMAIFGVNEAEKVYDKLPEIKNWYIMGHSMGGSMATSYAADNKEKLNGAILLGSYIYGDYPIEKSLIIYGTFNDGNKDKIDMNGNVVVIEGGNHAQFGNYGKQAGDPDATITAEEQQNIAVDAIMNFIEV